MPNISSAKKQLRQNKVRRVRNLRTQSAYQKAAKDLKKLAAAGNATEASAKLSHTYSLIDTAHKKKIISDKKASRAKSQVAKAIKAAGGKMPVGKTKKEAPKASTKKAAAPKAAKPAKKVAKKASPKKK